MTNLVGVTRLELATSSAVGSGDGLSATGRTRLGNIIHEIMTNLVGVTRLEGFFAGAKSQVLNPY